MSNAALGGPRRARPVRSPASHGPPPLPPPAAVRAIATPASSVPSAPSAPSAAARPVPSRSDVPTVRPPRPRPPRGRWFALGMLAGLVVAVVARGEGPATLHDLREWSARALRSLEHRGDRHPHTEVSAPGPLVAVAAATSRPSVTHEAPCPIDPAPGDPCAELLAPFMTKAMAAVDVPIFPVESLPRVKPAVIARRHHARPAAAVRVPAPAQPREADVDVDEDDAKSTAPPASPKSDDVALPERVPIVSPEQTAENDLR